jgi:hypothetical protein
MLYYPAAIEEGFDNIAEVDDEIRGVDVACKHSEPPQSTTSTIYKVAAKQH